MKLQLFFTTFFLFLVITTSTSTSSTFQWTSLNEESQVRISSQVYSEVRLFDKLLGTLLSRRTEKAWRAEVLPREFTFEDVSEEMDRYLETLALWAKSRYYDLLVCPSLENEVLEERQAEVQQKYFVSCQYLKTLLNRYYSEDEEDYAKDSEYSVKLKESMAKLVALYQGEDALDELMTSTNDSAVLKRLWTAQSKATSGLGATTFQEIMATLASSGRGEILWNRWNADLGIFPVNQSLSLAVELWSGELKEFYDLLLDFIVHRLNSNNKNGSIEIQELRSFSATSFDQLLQFSKIIPYPKLQNENSLYLNLSKAENFKEKAQEVFASLGFEKLPESYWKNSVFKEKKDNSCHPLTFYFFRKGDVRTRLCYQKSNLGSSWRRLLHELGHAHYYLSYDNASLFNLYKSRPNSAVHEAVGEAVILLQKGCLSMAENPQELINRLFEEAVTSFIRLPYALSLERWRFEMMNGEISLKSVKAMNDRYWEIREEVSRVKRASEEEDEDENSSLDPLSKYHVAHFIPYLRYFYGTLMMHQIQAALCKGVDSTPLANCCPKEEPKQRFREFLAHGALPEEYLQSTWNMLTGGNDEFWSYRAEPLLEYYRPLIEWLKEYRLDNH